MTAANIVGFANFFIKSRRLSIVLVGMQLGYLVYKYQQDGKSDKRGGKAKKLKSRKD